MSGMMVLWAGVDVSDNVDELSLDIESSLAQGSGTGNGAPGRAAVLSMKVALGAMGSAIGAGTVPLAPRLVRMGEVIIYDALGNIVFGGFAGGFDDMTEYTRGYTTVDCYDYYQHLARTIVQNEVYTGRDDVYIINDLLSKYATWIDRSLLPATGTYTFSRKLFRNVTLQDAIQQIIDTAGWQFWITTSKVARYINPTGASTAPFTLSTSPNNSSSFPCQVQKFSYDDTSIINRVYFFGGKKPSDDFTQDLNPQANSSNTTFSLAYYPHEASDGKIHVKKNGVELVLGFALGDQAKPDNVLKSAGGNADVLLNSDAQALTFDVAPLKTDTLVAIYRYEIPLQLVLTDQKSLQFFGSYFDGSISDDQVFDVATAMQRCRVLLLQQSFGLTSITVRCWKPGIQPGQILRLDHYVRAIHDAFTVQKVKVVPLGAGQFAYDIDLGAWNWNLVDLMVQTTRAAAPVDTSTEESSTPIIVVDNEENATAQDAWTTSTFTMGQFYARTSAVGDGHDAYCGRCSVSS